jgi:hypothetical protein
MIATASGIECVSGLTIATYLPVGCSCSKRPVSLLPITHIETRKGYESALAAAGISVDRALAFGTLGTQLLIDPIAGRGAERPRMVVLPAEFVVRKSCGATRRLGAS